MLLSMFGVTLTLAVLITFTTATWTYEGTTVTLALVNYTYRDPRRDGILVEVGQVGKYAPGLVSSASGRVITAKSDSYADDQTAQGDSSCLYPWSKPSSAPASPWIALVGKGDCPDKDKVEIAAASNASAIIIYSNDPHAHLRKIAVEEAQVPVVWLGEEEGRGLEVVVGGGAEVVITLSPGHHLRYHVTSINKTSVLFVSVSFIILMAISLAWLVFYYVQRFRYIHAKDRLARHLCNAAKKALAKIPVKNLKATDREVVLEGECCAVCIEHYQVGEAIRTLPCKHQFHRCCVDPWLLEHRTCPMCKMDILKHYGYVLSESEESVLQLDLGEGGEGGVGVIDSPYPLPLDPHSTHTASHLTPVVMVSRSESFNGVVSGGVGGSGVVGRRRSVGGYGGAWHDGIVMGVPVPDVPISPIHSPSPPSLYSLLSSSSKNVSRCSSRPPTPPPCITIPEDHQGTTSSEDDLDMELSSVSSQKEPPPSISSSSITTQQLPSLGASAFAAAPECVQVVTIPVRQPQVHEEGRMEAGEQATAATEDSSNPPTPPKRTRKRSTPDGSSLGASASHVVSVSHF